jgi:hypothetical protein
MGGGLQLHESGCVSRILEIMGSSNTNGGSSSICEIRAEKLTELQEKNGMEERTMQSCR